MKLLNDIGEALETLIAGMVGIAFVCFVVMLII